MLQRAFCGTDVPVNRHGCGMGVPARRQNGGGAGRGSGWHGGCTAGRTETCEKDNHMRALRLALLLAIPSMAGATSDELGRAAERFAGAPVLVDARLAARSCAPAGFRFAWIGRAIEARCEATGERLLIALDAPAEEAKLKRGESVQAAAVGKGFQVTVGAVADTVGRDGRVTLRNSRSGQRFTARMDETGRIVVSEAGE